MRRPGLWVANGDPGNTSQMFSWRPGAITGFFDHLVVNDVFNYKAANADVPVIIRFQHPLDWQKDPNGSAQTLGQHVASKWSELQPLDPYVYFANQMNMHYENGDQNPANQHLYTTAAFYQKYADWVRITADVIKNVAPDMKLVTPPFAFGFNEDGSPGSNGNPIKGWAGYDFLHETVRNYFDNTLTFHAFWGYPASGSVPDWLYEPELSTWYAFRWQRVLKLFETRYNLNARVIIDKAASFGPADPDFTDQLIYYAEQCLSDARIIALTYFLWSDPTNHPLYRPNAWVEGIPNLAEHLNRLNNMPDIVIIGDPGEADFSGELTGILEGRDMGAPADILDDATPTTLTKEVVGEEVAGEVAPDIQERTIRVLFEDGTVQTMPLEEYLRGVVPGEMPALWPMEAIKTQAVAARSYAQYAIEHPRHHPNADICTTVHCQHYDSSRIDPNSDDAIQQTRGIVVLYEGKTVNTVYSARCGGHTQNNEDVWKKGRPVPYLRGVSCPDKGEKHGHGVGFCQHGARVFATQGRTYEEILKHYYQGITLGPAPTG